MKTLRTKVIMSAIVLAFALIATIGSTYAWFTVSNTVSVNSFTVNTESRDSLLIRVWETGDTGDMATDGWTLDDFYTTVDIEDSADYDTEIAAAYFTPVTALTGETVTPGTPDYYATDYSDIDFTALRELSDNAISSFATYGRELNAAAANTASGGYIELKFWLVKPSGINTNVTFTYSVTDNSGATDYEDAMYFGVVADSGQYIFADDPEFTFAWVDGDAGYANGALDAIATSSLIGDATVSLITVAEDTNTYFTAHLGTVDSTSIMTLGTALTPELVTVYIWIEGWDSDATNAVMGASFDITLSFSLVA